MEATIGSKSPSLPTTFAAADAVANTSFWYDGSISDRKTLMLPAGGGRGWTKGALIVAEACRKISNITIYVQVLRLVARPPVVSLTRRRRLPLHLRRLFRERGWTLQLSCPSDSRAQRATASPSTNLGGFHWELVIPWKRVPSSPKVTCVCYYRTFEIMKDDHQNSKKGEIMASMGMLNPVAR